MGRTTAGPHQGNYKYGVIDRRQVADVRLEHGEAALLEGTNWQVESLRNIRTRSPGHRVDAPSDPLATPPDPIKPLLTTPGEAYLPAGAHISNYATTPTTRGQHGIAGQEGLLGWVNLVPVLPSAEDQTIKFVRLRGLRQFPQITSANDDIWRYQGDAVPDARVIAHGKAKPPLSVDGLLNTSFEITGQRASHGQLWNNIPSSADDATVEIGAARFIHSPLALGQDLVPMVQLSKLENLNDYERRVNRENRYEYLDVATILEMIKGASLFIYDPRSGRREELPYVEAIEGISEEEEDNREYATDRDYVQLRWPNRSLFNTPLLDEYAERDEDGRYTMRQTFTRQTYYMAIAKKGTPLDVVFPYTGGVGGYDTENYNLNVYVGANISTTRHGTVPIVSLEGKNIPTTSGELILALNGVTSDGSEAKQLHITADLEDSAKTVFKTQIDEIEFLRSNEITPAEAYANPPKLNKMTNATEAGGQCIATITPHGIWPFLQEPYSNGVYRAPCYIDFGEEIDPHYRKYIPDRYGFIFAHYKLRPFALAKLADGVFCKVYPDWRGLPADFKPSAVGERGGRLGFAGTDDLPAGYWFSRKGNFLDFDWENANTELPTSPLHGELGRAQGRIWHIANTSTLSLLTDAQHWAMRRSSRLAPNEEEFDESSNLGADPRCDVVDVEGHLAYMIKGLGSMVFARYSDEAHGFVPEPMTLESSSLFLNQTRDPMGLGISYDDSSELHSLIVQPGAGKAVHISILPSQNMAASTPWTFDRRYELVGARSEIVTGVDVNGYPITYRRYHGGVLTELDPIHKRPVLAGLAVKGEYWVTIADSIHGLVQLRVPLQRPDMDTLPFEGFVEAEFETMPIIMPSNQATGVFGGSFLEKRRIVNAELYIINQLTKDDPGRILVGKTWYNVTKEGIFRIPVRDGWGKVVTFKFFTESPLNVIGHFLKCHFTRG